MLFNSDVEEYYREKKNQMNYFKAFEHTSHNFFQISGFFANEFNMEKPVFYLVPPDQLSGMFPYRKAASDLYYRESIEMELKIKAAALLGHLALVFVSVLGLFVLL